MGAVAFAAGVSGIYVTQSQASGGLATGFYVFLSLVTMVAALVSITLGDGTGEQSSGTHITQQGYAHTRLGWRYRHIRLKVYTGGKERRAFD